MTAHQKSYTNQKRTKRNNDARPELIKQWASESAPKEIYKYKKRKYTRELSPATQSEVRKEGDKDYGKGIRYPKGNCLITKAENYQKPSVEYATSSRAHSLFFHFRYL